MLKLFENRFINTMDKLAVSIEDIKRDGSRAKPLAKPADAPARSSPPPSPRAGSQRDATTPDFMLDQATLLDHQRLMQNLSDMLGREQEKERKRECDRQEERARDAEQHNSILLALAAQTQKLDKLEQVIQHVCLLLTRSDEPTFEEVHQKMDHLKDRLGKLRAAQQALAGKKSNHTRERGGGRDTERLRALSSRTRSSLRPQSDIADQSRSDLRNAIFPTADGGGGGRFPRLSRHQPVASIPTATFCREQDDDVPHHVFLCAERGRELNLKP